MFDDNKKLHMRNINDKLTLNDVVNFHEIITSQSRDPMMGNSPINNLGVIGRGNEIHNRNQKRPSTAKATSNSKFSRRRNNNHRNTASTAGGNHNQRRPMTGSHKRGMGSSLVTVDLAMKKAS